MKSKLGSWGEQEMRSSLGRAVAAAAGLMTLLAPTAASASWWDGGYSPARRHSPPPTTTTTGYNSPPTTAPAPPPPTTTTTGYNSPPPTAPAPAPGPAPAPPPPAPGGSIYGCENSTLPDTELLLEKTTTPPPGTPVRPGDEIVVEITWRITDWLAPELHKALDCVYVNGRYAPGLSGGERPTANDGHFAYRYVVPDVPPGSTICDQGFVSGPNGSGDYGREVSNIVCFPVRQPSPPPPPPVATTTTTAAVPPPRAERLDLQAPPETPPSPRAAPAAPPGAKVRSRDVLPRTGADANPARLAAGALALAALGRRGARRRARPPRR
jgi:hypothetical protein